MRSLFTVLLAAVLFTSCHKEEEECEPIIRYDVEFSHHITCSSNAIFHGPVTPAADSNQVELRLNGVPNYQIVGINQWVVPGDLVSIKTRAAEGDTVVVHFQQHRGAGAVIDTTIMHTNTAVGEFNWTVQ
jgi:hypothetical protein